MVFYLFYLIVILFSLTSIHILYRLQRNSLESTPFRHTIEPSYMCIYSISILGLKRVFYRDQPLLLVRRETPPKNKILQEGTSGFKKKYLQETEALDRTKTHLQSLRRAEEKGKTPAGITITVKPNMMEKEEARFKSAWNLAIANAEKSLMGTLQSHLERYRT